MKRRGLFLVGQFNQWGESRGPPLAMRHAVAQFDDSSDPLEYGARSNVDGTIGLRPAAGEQA